MAMSVVMVDFLLHPRKMDGRPKETLKGKCFGGNLNTLQAIAERGLIEHIEYDDDAEKWSYEYTPEGRELVKGLQNKAIYKHMPGRYPWDESHDRFHGDYVWPFSPNYVEKKREERRKEAEAKRRHGMKLVGSG